jgi:uncharacterized protein YndB with AHSA1/START domain
MSKAEFVVDKEKLEVRITKVFNATSERLWQAFTTPAEIEKWWDKTTVDKHDFKIGGQWRFVSKDDEDPNKEYAFRGEFKEIDEPNKITRTFEFEPWAGHIMVETVTFEAMPDNQTKMVTVSKYDNLDDLEGMVKSGMERGATAGLNRLAKLVEES